MGPELRPFVGREIASRGATRDVRPGFWLKVPDLYVITFGARQTGAIGSDLVEHKVRAGPAGGGHSRPRERRELCSCIEVPQPDGILTDAQQSPAVGRELQRDRYLRMAGEHAP